MKGALTHTRRELQIVRIHSIRKGGILLETGNQDSLDKASALIEGALKPNVKIVSKRHRNPQFIVKNVPDSPSFEILRADLIEMNNLTIPPESLKEITRVKLKNNQIH